MRLINKLDRYFEDKEYEIIVKNKSINIINFNEIIDFSTNKISIKCESKIIDIDGKNLVISKMIDDEVLITGIILNIRIS